jgi:hypothetical protein
VRQHVRTVQGRNRDQVEEGQEEVDEDHVVQRLEERACNARASGELEHDAGRDRREAREGQVRHDARQGHPDVTGHVVAVVGRVHRDRLRPPEDDAPAHGQHQRDDHRPDKIQVGDGVQRDPAQALRGVVPLAARLPGVRHLVDDHGRDEHRDQDDGLGR